MTIISTNGVVVTNLTSGECYETIIDGTVQFQASQPVQVAQFANGNSYDNLTNSEGDPCEILLPPANHYLTSYTIVTPNPLDSNYDFDRNFLSLIVQSSAITNTSVDDSLVTATNFTAIGSSGYYGTQILVTNGTHTVKSSLPVEVQVYGFGPADAYSYFGGITK